MSRVTTITCTRCGELCGPDMLVLKPVAGDPGGSLEETVDFCGKCRAWFLESLRTSGKAADPDNATAGKTLQ
jgi:hypothetical protein